METTRCPSAAILDEVAELEVERARVEGRIAAKMLAFEDACRVESEWTDDLELRRVEMSFAAEELGAVLHQAVQARLAEARRVRGRMPATWLAHLRGEIDGWKVRLIASIVYNLCEPDSVVQLDAKVVAYASTHTTTQTKAWLRRFVARVEPDRHQVRARRALSDRQVWVDHQDDGLSWVHASMATSDAVRIDQSLTHQAKLLPSDDRTLDNKRADLLADLLMGRDGTGTDGTATNRAGAVIAVKVPITSLAGLTDEPGESFDDQFALPADLVRDLAREPGTLFYRLLTDPLGHILDVAELGRFPSARLRITVQARDGTCSVPTCSRPAMECDLDHEEPYPRGPTSGDNLRPLCRKHHRMKTRLNDDFGLLSMRGSTSRFEHDIASWIVNQEYAA
ncbi:MAG: hypothetical protein JWR83_2418 [Aeromicrobium sp.]|nr:hypothetical protein [Aeromicrobium sp.]